jgi:hypothetical protein
VAKRARKPSQKMRDDGPDAAKAAKPKPRPKPKGKAKVYVLRYVTYITTLINLRIFVPLAANVFGTMALPTALESMCARLDVLLHMQPKQLVCSFELHICFYMLISILVG